MPGTRLGLYFSYWWVVIITIVFIAACTVMETGSPSVSKRCGDVLGTYSLSRTLLNVKYSDVIKNDGSKSGAAFEYETVRTLDGQPLCLDYLSSITAKDNLQVTYAVGAGTEANDPGDIGPNFANGKKHGLLQFISNDSEDFSATIVRSILRAGFIRRSGNAAFEPASFRSGGVNAKIGSDEYKVIDLDHSFDPLDSVALAEANHALNDRGLCFVLGRYSFDTSAASVENYCSSPLATLKRAPSRAPEITGQNVSRTASTPGILYRPRLDYNIALYTKRDPDSSKPWVLTALHSVPLENLSPIMSVGVSRAIFSQEETTLVFEDGDLKEVCVEDGSEIIGALNIPLEIVRSIVALPAEIIKIDIDQVNDRRELAAAEAKLLEAQRKVIELQLGQQVDSFPQGNQNPTKPELPTPSDVGLDTDNLVGSEILTSDVTVCGSGGGGQ